MKKLLSLVLALLLLLLMTATAGADLQNRIAIGMTHDEVRAALDESGDTALTDSETEESLFFETEEQYISLTFDAETGLVDWINLTVLGEEAIDLDFTIPDWTLKFDSMLATLQEKKLGYDMYVGLYGNALFFKATVFGKQTEVYTSYTALGDLDRVEINLYDGESPLEWAAAMALSLGAPKAQYGVSVENGNQFYTTRDGMYWYANDNYYTLENRNSVYSFPEEDNVIGSVGENWTFITISKLLYDPDMLVE